jgi:hypothetical protein
MSDYLGVDTPNLRNNTWFAPDRTRHDMWFYDLGNIDMVEDKSIVWSKSSISQFAQKPETNLVHQVIVDNNIYEGDSFYISNIPYISHNEDEAEWEEQIQGYEEKEIGTYLPENLVAGQSYYVKTYWETVRSSPGWFTTDTELTKCGYQDCWSPAGHQELGQMYFQSTNNDEWLYNSPNYRQGWTAYNVSDTSVTNGIFNIDPAGYDPYIISPALAINADEYKRIELRIASNMLDWYGNIYFKTSSSNFYSESKNISFSVPYCPPSTCSGKAGFRNLSIYTGNHPQWKGTITGIRIDPGNQGMSGTKIDTVGFDYIRLSR